MESLISSSSASTSRRKCKGEWTSNLYFYPDVDDHRKKGEFVITQDELLAWQKVQKLFGENEDIKKVKVYSNPLFSIQPGKGPLHHATVLFQTKNSGTWWSIEKNTKSITIQTSKNGPEPVRKYYNRIQRPEGPMAPNTKDRTAGSTVRLYQLIHHFCDEKYLKDPYNLQTSNCQHFAERIFDFLSVRPYDCLIFLLKLFVVYISLTCGMFLIGLSQPANKST
uniref:Uncharacterized protein n=1 Tax=Daphnia galeata TaxID=27404 RepID=A0A8J2WPL2_9CRUS|nr:unnamed protein product [Daphnia galeata]